MLCFQASVNASTGVLSDIKRKAQPSVLYLIKHELRVFWIASKTIHFIPILSLCLRKNFEYRCCISRENRGKSFVKIYVCFITYKDSFTAMIFFVFCSWSLHIMLACTWCYSAYTEYHSCAHVIVCIINATQNVIPHIMLMLTWCYSAYME